MTDILINNVKSIISHLDTYREYYGMSIGLLSSEGNAMLLDIGDLEASDRDVNNMGFFTSLPVKRNKTLWSSFASPQPATQTLIAPNCYPFISTSGLEVPDSQVQLERYYSKHGQALQHNFSHVESNIVRIPVDLSHQSNKKTPWGGPRDIEPNWTEDRRQKLSRVNAMKRAENLQELKLLVGDDCISVE